MNFENIKLEKGLYTSGKSFMRAGYPAGLGVWHPYF